jgi:hypothetical protein
MNVMRMISIVIFIGLVVWMGLGSTSLAQVYRGTAFSAEDLTRAQLSVQNRLRGLERAGFAYCVCKKDRSKIIYVYALSGEAQKSLAASCEDAAANCGGCFKPPLVSMLRSSAYNAAQDDARRRRFFTLFGSEGDMGKAPKKVLPETPTN